MQRIYRGFGLIVCLVACLGCARNRCEKAISTLPRVPEDPLGMPSEFSDRQWADVADQCRAAEDPKLIEMITRRRADLAEATTKAQRARAEVDAARAKAQAEALAALRQKITKKYWANKPDGECTGKGLPPYRWDYEGGTYAEDQTVAEAEGCVKLHQTVELQTYCCPDAPQTSPW